MDVPKVEGKELALELLGVDLGPLCVQVLELRDQHSAQQKQTRDADLPIWDWIWIFFDYLDYSIIVAPDIKTMDFRRVHVVLLVVLLALTTTVWCREMGRPTLSDVGTSSYTEINKKLDEFFTAELGDMLGCDEQYLGVASGWVDSWSWASAEERVSEPIRWNATVDTPNGLAVAPLEALKLMLYLIDPISSTSVVENCVEAAQAQLATFNASIDPEFFFSLTIGEWEKAYDMGAYRRDLETSFSVPTEDGGTESVSFSADSLVRVDIAPGSWFLPSFPYVARTARVEANEGYCPKGALTVADCFFDVANGGLWTSMPSGLIITSNCVVETKVVSPGGNYNGTTTCQKDQPELVGVVIERMPIRTQRMCPCASHPPITDDCVWTS